MSPPKDTSEELVEKDFPDRRITGRTTKLNGPSKKLGLIVTIM